LYVGGSSGAVVAGALKYARKLDRPLNIVVLLPDSAAKYLSKIYNDAWMREHGFLDDAIGLGTVSDLMKARDQKLVTTKPSTRVRDVIALLKSNAISQVPVVEDGRLIGAVSEVELLRYLATGEHSLDSTVGSLVESDYASVSPDTKIELVQGLLADARMAVVLDGDNLIGVITKIDLIEYLARKRGPRSVIPPVV
jgi:cystathionine beta-synthase